MNAPLETGAAAMAYIDAATAGMRATLAEMIAGDGGVLLFALGAIGVGVLASDLVQFVVRRARRRRLRRKPARTLQARTLAAEGVAPEEIARRIGLSRDAVLLLTAQSVAATRPNLPPAARSAGIREPAPTWEEALQAVAQKADMRYPQADSGAAQPLPLRLPRTAHRRRLGEVA